MSSLGPFETLQHQPKYSERAVEWQLEQEELFVEQSMGNGEPQLFATAAGVARLDKSLLLTAL